MKARIYPWLLGAAALTVFSGYFFFYFTNLYATATIHPAQGILPSMNWNSSEAFVIFLVAVWSFAALCGLVTVIIAALFFEHMSMSEEQPHAIAEQIALKQAA